MNLSSRRAETHMLAAVVMAVGFPAFAAEPELPAGAIGRLGAHRFVHAKGERVRWLGFTPGDRRIFTQSDDNTLGAPPKLFPLPERRRSSRAIKALECAHTRTASYVLERLARGWSAHPQTTEAKAALARKAN